MKKLIKMYIESINNTRKYGEEICNKFVEVLKPIISDIECSLGWAEAGIDTICLWSDSHDVTRFKKGVMIDHIIEEVFPELNGRIDAPYGVWLSKEEAEKVKQALLKLRAKMVGENR